MGIEKPVDILNPIIDILADSNDMRKINGCSSPVIININKKITFGNPNISKKLILIKIRRKISKLRCVEF